jgi:membrane-associated phospholipid phosphatase
VDIDEFDRRVDKMFDRLRGNRVADRVFYGASAIGDHGMLWILLGAARGVLGDRRGATRVIVGAGLESIIVNGGIKLLFRRSRPVVDEPRPLPLRIPLTSSFPSGHASSAFFAATLLSDGAARMAPVYFAAASVVAASRVYVKIHHASDVIGGVAVGLLLGRIGRRLYPLESPVTERG